MEVKKTHEILLLNTSSHNEGSCESQLITWVSAAGMTKYKDEVLEKVLDL